MMPLLQEFDSSIDSSSSLVSNGSHRMEAKERVGKADHIVIDFMLAVLFCKHLETTRADGLHD